VTPRTVATFLIFILLPPLLASEKKEWVKLDDCHYVDWQDNDGDSFRARCGEKEFTARLYHVDAPETSLHHGDRVREQSLHFGITLDETLNAGEKAKQRVKELLQKSFVLWTRWATAGGRGKESRYYVIIEADGKNLAEILVSDGLARTKGMSATLPSGEKGKEFMEHLDELETVAREKHLGAWANSKTEAAPPTPSATSSPSLPK
jgi:endonuclease YncB( thermonuclease family)